MDPVARAFLMIGGLLLVGLATDAVARRTPLPRVTLLILLGVIAGPSVAGLLSERETEWFPVAATVALSMVGFLVGGEFTTRRLRQDGAKVVAVAAIAGLVTAVVVIVGLGLLGFGLATALLLGGIATATDPAATIAVAQETGARGPFTRTLLGVVAVDDAIALGTFSLLVVGAAIQAGGSTAGLWQDATFEVGGALLLGVGVGIPMAYLTGRVTPGEPSLEEALGGVLLCAGVAIWLDVSVLLAAVTLGATVANLASHHTRPFHEIEHIEWPFLIVFFVLAGASLELETLADIGAIGVAFVLLRTAGKVGGGWLAGIVAAEPPEVSRWLGAALLPQAGVALGLALIAAERLPTESETVLTVTVVATVVFELAGPLLTRVALGRVGELPAGTG